MINPDMWVGIGVAVATLFGWALCLQLLPSTLRRFTPVLAPATGLAICSLLYLPFRRPMFTVEGLLILVSLALLFRRRSDALPVAPERLGLLSLTFATLMGFTFFAVMARVERLPHGEWDGWAIWSSHARVLVRTGSNWLNHLQYTFHGDYPELTPTLTARFWRYAGMEFSTSGGIIGIILGLSAAVVLVAVLSELRGSHVGLIMGFILIGTPFYLEHMASQYSEVPLSFYNLMAVALLCLQAERAPSNRSMLVLAGFAAGCAGWTKNEGLLFIAAISAALLLPVFRRRAKVTDRFVPFVAGLIVPLAVIIVFKAMVPVQTDLIEHQSWEAFMNRVTDPERYTLTFTYFLQTFWNFGAWQIKPLIPLVVFLALRGINTAVTDNAGWRATALVFVIVMAGYYIVYINTPLNLKDHLDSSFNRLVVHVWPSFLLWIGMCARKDPIVPSPSK